MRAIGPALIVTVALWASLAWCFVAARTIAGHDHMHLSSREFGAFLFVIDLAFAAAIVWQDRLKRRDA